MIEKEKIGGKDTWALRKGTNKGDVIKRKEGKSGRG